MGRRRQCRFCREPYDPDPRTAKHQRACGRPECQRARHAAACASWRAKNPDYDRERRLRERVVVDPPPASPDTDPRDGIRWDRVRDALSLEATVVAYELAGILVRHARDAMTVATGVQPMKPAKISAPPSRDETGRRGPAP